MTLTRTIKLYSLPEQPQTAGLRPMRESDCEVCCKKLNEYLMQFVVAPQLSLAEFKHWLLPRQGVVYTYVVEDAATKEITDMVSFYSLPGAPPINACEARARAVACVLLPRATRAATAPLLRRAAHSTTLPPTAARSSATTSTRPSMPRTPTTSTRARRSYGSSTTHSSSQRLEFDVFNGERTRADPLGPCLVPRPISTDLDRS